MDQINWAKVIETIIPASVLAGSFWIVKTTIKNAMDINILFTKVRSLENTHKGGSNGGEL